MVTKRVWGEGTCRIGAALVILLAAHLAPAAEQGGLLVDVQKKILSRNDHITPDGVGSMSVDRMLSLKVDIKNTAMRNMETTKVDYTVLIQRWNYETGTVERFEGSSKIDALAVAHSTSVNLGEFHIGGHLHSSSEMHVDRLIAWKLVMERDGRALTFVSGSNFETLNKRATKTSH